MNNYRKPLNKRSSKKYFSKTADHTHKLNMNTSTVMRGGTRL